MLRPPECHENEVTMETIYKSVAAAAPHYGTTPRFSAHFTLQLPRRRAPVETLSGALAWGRRWKTELALIS